MARRPRGRTTALAGRVRRPVAADRRATHRGRTTAGLRDPAGAPAIRRDSVASLATRRRLRRHVQDLGRSRRAHGTAAGPRAASRRPEIRTPGPGREDPPCGDGLRRRAVAADGRHAVAADRRHAVAADRRAMAFRYPRVGGLCRRSRDPAVRLGRPRRDRPRLRLVAGPDGGLPCQPPATPTVRRQRCPSGVSSTTIPAAASSSRSRSEAAQSCAARAAARRSRSAASAGSRPSA